MFSKKTGLGEKTSETSSGTAQPKHSNDPLPEDLPIDAQPGTDEEFGMHAAMSHFESQKTKSNTQAESGKKASDHFGDSIEGVLLSG